MDASNLVVSIGCTVELELLSDGETERLLLVLTPDAQADFYAGFLGASSTLAQAILGKSVGAQIPFGPNNDDKVHILAVIPAPQGRPDAGLQTAKENAARRQQSLDQTRRQIERTNAIIFSTTVEGKWGEYDTDGIEEW